jgi:membrane protein YqaA with SNARE-associated domain
MRGYAGMNILLETAWKASIVPLGNDPTFFAMKAFGGYDMRPAFALAVAGASIGQLFNWGLGRLLRSSLRGVAPKPKADDAAIQSTSRKSGLLRYARNDELTALFNSYGIFALLFCWVPLCNFVVVIAAFAGAKPKLALPLIIIGEAAHYGWYLL